MLGKSKFHCNCSRRDLRLEFNVFVILNIIILFFSLSPSYDGGLKNPMLKLFMSHLHLHTINHLSFLFFKQTSILLCKTLAEFVDLTVNLITCTNHIENIGTHLLPIHLLFKEQSLPSSTSFYKIDKSKNHMT